MKSWIYPLWNSLQAEIKRKKEKKKAATLTGRNYFFGDNLNIPTVWNVKRKKSG